MAWNEQLTSGQAGIQYDFIPKRPNIWNSNFNCNKNSGGTNRSKIPFIQKVTYFCAFLHYDLKQPSIGLIE